MTNYSLGPLEQEVMRCMWEGKEKSVREVYSCIKQKRKIAYTTIMTIMTRLHDKGYLSRKKQGKAFLYKAKKTKRETARVSVKKIIDSLINQYGVEAVSAVSDELNKRKK